MSMVARLDPRTWPIRWQLTALNVGVHAATLVALSVIFLAQLDGALVGLTAENARDKVRLLADDRRPPPPFADDAGRPPGAPGSGRAPGSPEIGRPPGGPEAGRPQQPFNLQRAAAFAVRRLSGPDSGVMVFDPNGQLVDATQTYEDQEAWPLPPPEQPLRPVPVALGPLVEEIAAQTRLLANGQEIVVRIDRPATVMADPDRLKQVLLNLMANALRFTPAGGEIALRLSTSDQRAILQVSDTGSGIAPELLPRVMDRFVRGDASRARVTGDPAWGSPSPARSSRRTAAPSRSRAPPAAARR